jgi:hypothetical protein
VGVERAEPARERRVLVLVEVLIVLDDLVPVRVAQRAGEVRPADLRADRGLKRPDGFGSVNI